MHFLDDDVELVDGLPKIFRQQFVELQLLDQQVEGISANVKEAKRRLFTEYANLSKDEIGERSNAIKEDYKKMKTLCTKKCQLSSDLEQIMDRVNNKVKKDTDDFRCELEAENPGCTYEFEKKFTEECDKKAFFSGRSAEEKMSAREAQLMYNGGRSGTRLFGTNKQHEKHSSTHRRSLQEKSMRKLLIDTSGSTNLLNVNDRTGRPFNEHGSTTSSFRPSPVSVDYSLTPSTSRFTTPRHTPGPVSPAIRKSFNPSNRKQPYANGSNVPQSAPANYFQSDAIPTQFDPTATNMPAFANTQESRHGRPRKLTTRVKQMLNEQKAHHRSGYNNMFGSQGISPLSSQGISVAGADRQRNPQFKGQSSRRQSTASHSANIVRQQKQSRLKRSSVIDDDEGSRDVEEMEDEEFGSESAEQDDESEDYTEEVDDYVDEEETDTQLWCFCHTKSYGNMICCDNQNCPYTWFHYACIGLTESPPPGLWYCPACRDKMVPNSQLTQSSRH